MWIILLAALLIPSVSFAQVQCFTSPNGSTFSCYGNNGYVAQFFTSPDKGLTNYYDNRGNSGALYQQGGGLSIYPNAPTGGPPPLPSLPSLDTYVPPPPPLGTLAMPGPPGLLPPVVPLR